MIVRPEQPKQPRTLRWVRLADMRANIGGAVAIMLAGACTPGVHRLHSIGGLDARAVAKLVRPDALAVPTGVYRGLVARSLYSRCQMFPSDSELFDRRARMCGATSAAVLGVARLFLEVEASPDVLPVTFADRRLRWLDLPPASDTCAP